MTGLVNVDVGQVTNVVQGIIDRIWPDKTAEQQKALDRELEILKGQAAINAVEASSPNMFIAGWRPFVGWVCGAGLAFDFLIRPTLAAFQIAIPAIDMGTLIGLLMAMLGIGGMRTVEKLNNVEGNR